MNTVSSFRFQVSSPSVTFQFREVQAAYGGNQIDWAALALDCGYYDQAHFIHDFEEFSGITPSAYWLQRSQHLNHVPLVD